MNISELFRQDDSVFTVFVVEQRFAVGQGHEYFHTFINKVNYITSEVQINQYIKKVTNFIEKRVAPIAQIINYIFKGNAIIELSEVISCLCKLFTVHEHQAAGPEVIDPIIIQEGKITYKSFTKIININKDSILSPTIIIILKDNDFERAKKELSECPNGINIKMIRNSGEAEIYKVINCGASDTQSFINSFAQQCFSTCSKTKRDVLLNSTWASNSLIKKHSPLLLKFRTNLLFDEKEEIKSDLSEYISSLLDIETTTNQDTNLVKFLMCISKLFRVYCNDCGGEDIIDAYKIAQDLNNDILLAQVYRYADFFPNISNFEKREMYDTGCRIFKENCMDDLAIYCRNNKLIHQFYTDNVNAPEFQEMQIEAVNNVPGMVGMSHIYNNVGIAFLYNGMADRAIEFFDKGLDYAKYSDRIVQALALETNKIIAESYSFAHIDENKFRKLMRKITDGMGTNKLPFISADYMLNVISVAYHQNVTLARELIHEFPVVELINTSFQTNVMGASERILQLQKLANEFNDSFDLLENCIVPGMPYETSGKRKDFILKYGYNPFELDTWL